MFFQAFIQKHRIFRDDPDAPGQEVDEDTVRRMSLLMSGMQDRQLRKALEMSSEEGE